MIEERFLSIISRGWLPIIVGAVVGFILGRLFIMGVRGHLYRIDKIYILILCFFGGVLFMFMLSHNTIHPEITHTSYEFDEFLVDYVGYYVLRNNSYDYVRDESMGPILDNILDTPIIFDTSF